MLPCAILCGGLATRLRPITETIPKSLIPINGEPFIAHQLRLLRSRGVVQIVLCVGHLGERIQEFVGSGSDFGLSVSYSFDGVSLRGTAGAVRNALPSLGQAFFVLYGDSYLSCNYDDVAQTFEAAKTPALMTIYRNEDRFENSNVEASEGRVVLYDKRDRKPGMYHIDYGLGVFARAAIESLPGDESLDLADVYRNLAIQGQLAAYEAGDRFYEIGSAQGIRELEQFLMRQSALTGPDAMMSSL